MTEDNWGKQKDTAVSGNQKTFVIVIIVIGLAILGGLIFFASKSGV